jgi:hypothetical protein
MIHWFTDINFLANILPGLFQVRGNLRWCSEFGNAVKSKSEIPAEGRKLVGGWLVGCTGMVFGAVALGVCMCVCVHFPNEICLGKRLQFDFMLLFSHWFCHC